MERITVFSGVNVREQSAVNDLDVKVPEDEWRRVIDAVDASTDGAWSLKVVTNEIGIASRWKRAIGYENHEFANAYDAWVGLIHDDVKMEARAALHEFILGTRDAFEMPIRVLQEARLIRAQEESQNAEMAKSEFFSQLGHEIRVRMTSIIGGTSFFSAYQMGPKESEFAGRIRSAGEVLQAIVDYVVDLIEIKSGQRELARAVRGFYNGT